MHLLLTGMLMSPVALILILILALLIFGKRLPEVARSLGKGIVEFKKGVKGIEDEVERPLPPPQQPYSNQYGSNQYGSGYAQQQYPPQNQYGAPPQYQNPPYPAPYQGAPSPASTQEQQPQAQSGGETKPV